MKKIVIFMFLLSIYLVNSNQELIIFSTVNSSIISDNFESIAIDSSNNTWVGGAFGGVMLLNNSKWVNVNYYENSYPIYSIEVDSFGNIWIGSENGLSLYNNQNWKHFNMMNSGILNQNIFSIAFEKDYLFMGISDNNLMLLHNNEWSIKCSMEDIDESIFSIAIDSNDIIWFGSKDEWNLSSIGLLYNVSSSCKIISSGFDNYPNGGVEKIKVDKYNNKWIAKDDGGGLVKFDDSIFTRYIIDNSGLPHDDVYDIAIDENDVKWIATGGGLAKFDGTNWTVWNTTNSDLPNDRINCIVIDKYGNKWMGTDGGGVAVFREGGVVGIEEQAKKYEISFSCYPNPANEEIKVNYQLYGTMFSELKIFDVFGRVVKQYDDKVLNDNNALTINIDNIPSGTYFLMFRVGNQTQLEKVQVLK